MKRFVSYFGTAATLAFVVFVVVYANYATVPSTVSQSAPTASSTVSVEPGFTLPTLVIPTLESATTETKATSSIATSTPKVVTTTAKKPKPVPEPVSMPVVIPTIPVSTPDPSVINAELDVSAAALRAALVNILCYAPVGSKIHSISGSGVFIDSKGIILTNAHVAQNFLLKNSSVSCIIRAGSPAADSYAAELIFISPAWVSANADILTKTAPIGTGEYDFALLAITKSVTRNALPSSFPYVPLASAPPTSLSPVVIASYGAQFLDSSQVQSGLFPTIVFGSVKDIFTFNLNTIDVLALGGSAAAQEGSSGGGVADASGKLVGTITTSTVVGTTDTRSLDAITASYIRADYATETGTPIESLLNKPTATSIADFAPQISTLGAILVAHLQ